MNAYAERFIRSAREDCLNHMILWSWDSLNYTIGEYLEFYNHERPHQGIEQRIIDPKIGILDSGVIQSKTRLGGLLNFYYTKAA